MMHSAKVESSDRLARTLHFIRGMRAFGATTKEIASWTGSVAVATDVSELRKEPNGYDIECLYDHTTATGRKVFRYYYRGKKEKA